MQFWMQIAGLGLSLGSALLIALADAWLSRSFLIYLDAIEASVSDLVGALRVDSKDFALTFVDLKRDRGQNRARALKTIGWLAMAVGLGLQITAACMTAR